MTTENGLISACILDGDGGGKKIGWPEIDRWSSEDGFLWIHFDYKEPGARRWIKQSAIDEIGKEVLLAEERRPRSVLSPKGAIVILRGVNLNPGAHPEDMVSIRMWIDGDHAITTRARKLIFLDDLRAEIERNAGPKTPGEFLWHICHHLAMRMADVIAEIEEKVDDLENSVLTMESHKLRPKLASVRRQAISIRRYLAPQREAMVGLQNINSAWLGDLDKIRLREVAERTTRYIEDLDSARERAAVTQEELASRLSEQMDKRMYILSLVAAIFLPLGFLTGVLGMNLAGMPGTKNPWSFALVCVAILFAVLVQIWIFKKKKWF